MSRRNVALEGNRTLTVGWDNPLQSYFYQVWNNTDEDRINELERKTYYNEITPEEEEELDLLLFKYKKTGGEPIIETFGADGVDVINHVRTLRTMLRKIYIELDPKVMEALIADKELGV